MAFYARVREGRFAPLFYINPEGEKKRYILQWSARLMAYVYRILLVAPDSSSPSACRRTSLVWFSDVRRKPQALEAWGLRRFPLPLGTVF